MPFGMYWIRDIAELCKGSTTDSDSVCLGSNPSSAATPAVSKSRAAGFSFGRTAARTAEKETGGFPLAAAQSSVNSEKTEKWMS